jgi:hypothetical protein
MQPLLFYHTDRRNAREKRVRKPSPASQIEADARIARLKMRTHNNLVSAKLPKSAANLAIMNA